MGWGEPGCGGGYVHGEIGDKYHCKNKNPPSVFETMNRKDGAENKNKQ